MAIFFFMSFAVSNVEPLLNDFVRPHQHVRRNSEADLLCSFQIYDELELGRLLDWNLSWLGSLQNFVEHGCDAPGNFGLVGSVGHQATTLDMNSLSVYGGQTKQVGFVWQYYVARPLECPGDERRGASRSLTIRANLHSLTRLLLPAVGESVVPIVFS